MNLMVSGSMEYFKTNSVFDFQILVEVIIGFLLRS